jgi:hypothetical protein
MVDISYAAWFNRKSRRISPLLQGVKAVIHDPIEAGWSIHEYIHLNPLRVKRFWASRTNRDGPSPEQIIQMIEELQEFRWARIGHTPGIRRCRNGRTRMRSLAWRRGDVEGETQAVPCTVQGKDWRWGWESPGRKGRRRSGPRSKDFVAKVREMLKGNRTGQKSLRALEKPPTDWQRITTAIEKLWGKPWEEISERHGDPVRELAMLIAERYGSMSLRKIGDAVGGFRYPAVSDAVRRTSPRLETDRALEKSFKRLL